MLDDMGKNLIQFNQKLNQLATMLDADYQKVIKLTVLKVLREIIKKSPVDTGAYRASHGVLFGKEPEDTEGIVIVNKGDKTDQTPALDNQENWDPTQPFVIMFNNVPYAEVIEDGHSDKAPEGVYAIALLDFIQLFTQEIEKFEGYN